MHLPVEPTAAVAKFYRAVLAELTACPRLWPGRPVGGALFGEWLVVMGAGSAVPAANQRLWTDPSSFASYVLRSLRQGGRATKRQREEDDEEEERVTQE